MTTSTTISTHASTTPANVTPLNLLPPFSSPISLNNSRYNFSCLRYYFFMHKSCFNFWNYKLQRLYQLGARKVITFEIGPIGCIPSITRQTKHNGTCVEEINDLAILFNNQLAPMLQTLTSTLPHSSFILGHGYWLGYDATTNPSKYGTYPLEYVCFLVVLHVQVGLTHKLFDLILGLTDSTNPCCVTWMNGTSGCIPGLGALACRHPEKQYFFDGYHLTETVYKTIATLCFNASTVCIPKNIKDLVSQA